MTITAAQVISAMIPAMRDWGKKMATIHATRNETQHLPEQTPDLPSHSGFRGVSQTKSFRYTQIA